MRQQLTASKQQLLQTAAGTHFYTKHVA